MNIFEKFDFTGYTITSAVRHLTRGDEYTGSRTAIKTSNGENEIEVHGSWSINAGGKVSRQQPVKVLIKDLHKKYRVCGFNEEEIDNDLIALVKTLEEMFESAPKETKRVW